MEFSLLVDAFEQMEMTSSRLRLTDYLVSLLRMTPTDIIEKVVYLIQGKLRPDFEGIEIGMAEKMILRSLAQSSGMGMTALFYVPVTGWLRMLHAWKEWLQLLNYNKKKEVLTTGTATVKSFNNGVLFLNY